MISNTFLGSWDTKLWWSISRTNCLYYFTRVDLHSHQILFEWNFRSSIFKLILLIDAWGTSSEIAFRWMSLDLTDDKSTSVQVMAWCLQAPSHYLSQCWPTSMLPYGINGPQWVKWNEISMVKHKSDVTSFLASFVVHVFHWHCIAP